MTKGFAAAEAVEIDHLTLRFRKRGDLEKAFRGNYFLESLLQVRIAIVLGIILYAVFGLLDTWLVPEVKTEIWCIRYVVVCPSLVLLLVFTFFPLFRRAMQVSISVVMLVAGWGIIAMIMIAPAPGNYLYYAGLMLVAVFLLFIKLRFVSTAIVALVFLASYEFAAFRLSDTPLVIIISNNFFFVSEILIILVVSYFMELYLRKNFVQQVELEQEREKAERLLLNILPESIAGRLKREQKTIADGFAEVTVLFADIAGFTHLAAHRSPGEIVDMLNSIFSAFDGLAERHGVEKIKTIGDAYMAVAGLPIQRPDHAEAVADMALDMKSAIARHGVTSESVHLRIGINTGPVVAGVIGMKRFIYDVWGDTVNTASRMETNGIPGEIHVTQETYDQLKDAYVLTPRGSLRIKGKGHMNTYLLVGKKPPAESRAGAR